MYDIKRIRMARKPGQVISPEDFRQESLQLAAPAAGEVVCKTRYISLDPYLAGMMQSWQGPQPEWSEGIIVGRMVGEIIASNDPQLAVGDWVTGDSHWQELEITPAKHLQKIAVDEAIPASVYLGILGSSGLTAWVGINRVLAIQAGDTMTVSSAAGTVGAIAGQLAMQRGAKVVGIAGGEQKCAEVVDTLKFSACIDHHASDLQAQLAAAVGDQLNSHFENVGAKTLDPVLALMQDHGRIALCGLIAHYLDDDAISLGNFRKLLTSGLRLQGFRLYDYFADAQLAQSELTAGIRSGAISIRETITKGLDNAAQAYIAMLGSGGIGKHLVYLPD